MNKKEHILRSNLQILSSSKNILLLQGPVGSFFLELSKWLSTQGCVVFKLNFNGGDEHFYPKIISNTYNYCLQADQFNSYLINFIECNHIDSIVCFGDTRFYHKIAKNYCQKNPNVKFWVFEEGYFRPEYITLEKDGVNDYSTLPRNADFFLKYSSILPEPRKPKKVTKGFFPIAKCAIIYYLYTNFKKEKYPNYKHHRKLDISYYTKLWVKSGIKRLYYYFKDYFFTNALKKGNLDPFFIVPLQVYDDTQIKYHCDYENINDFLLEVLDSFNNYASRDYKLIIKHHPMDRGFTNYKHIINSYKRKYPDLARRIYYIHDVPMPTLLRKAKGMVTINSTSGISALLHNIPVITLGRANYDIPQLTYQGKLNDFWKNKELPNVKVFNAYRKFHLFKTHINGSYYTKTLFK